MSQPAEVAATSPADHVKQLNDARKQVLANPKLYSSVVKGVVPLLGSSSHHLSIRRWTAEFVAETFATPALPTREKDVLAPFVLDTIQTIIENPSEDVHVLRNMIQTAASLYPIALRWINENAYDTITWERMMAVKTRILQMWDAAPEPLRICCVKFAQRVVLAQTSAAGIETRRGDFDINLDKVLPDHTVLDPRTLEAEAFGLLDRMLAILQDNSSDAFLVDTTINCIYMIMRARPNTSNRVLNTVLAFNPLKLANSPMTTKDRVLVKSIEKTTRMLLLHLTKKDPHNPNLGRVHQYVDRLLRIKTDIFDDSSRKRPFDAQQLGVPDAKRLRAAPAAAIPPQQADEIPPLGPPPHTLGAVFTLAAFQGLNTFDVSGVPLHLVSRINVSTLVGLDMGRLGRAVDAVKGRLNALVTAPPPVLNPDTAPLGVEEDDDDYEPDFYAAEDTEQILNKLDSSPKDLKAKAGDGFQLEVFKLPTAIPLTTEKALQNGRTALGILFEQMKAQETPAAKKPSKPGFNQFASGFGDRDSSITLLARLAARASAGLDDIVPKTEGDGNSPNAALGNDVRDWLHAYIVDDFRKRIDIAVAWLCEEWYNDRVQQVRSADNYPQHYERLALKLLDGMLPYFHPQDRILTRFLGEIPQITSAILACVKQMCRDPTLVSLALTSLLYVVMMKPPVQDLALDTIEAIWTEYEDARPLAAKYLTKYRPAFLEQATRTAAEAETNGTMS